ncbi:MAG: reverse transcriptase family protein [Planctomycetia bacterium]|nr:reverse transcriptase family protein [Planctomycetia bacterium]
MRPFRNVVQTLAASFLAGKFDGPGLLQRSRPLLSRHRTWLPKLIKRVIDQFGEVSRPRRAKLIKFLLADEPLRMVWEKSSFELKQQFVRPEFIVPDDVRATWAVPKWATIGELATWLGLETNELAWFADRKGLERHIADGPLRHYQYRWFRKRGGHARLIEVPKTRLKIIQQRLLSHLFESIPTHSAAHGFCKGRSVKTYVEPHVSQTIVLRMDLQDFFPSIEIARLTGQLMGLGYPEEVARTLTALCSNRVPADAWRTFPDRENWERRRNLELLLQRSHFPQGAPTSPAIANLCAYRLDCRLAGLATWASATYTRYADDLLFSGGPDFSSKLKRFHIYVAAVALDEGFQVNHHKTRIMTQSQQQRAAGVVLNAKPNVPRPEYDQLKAILHQATLTGPTAQNRNHHHDFRNHLAGRIAYISQWNPQRGEKLQRLFAKITW